MALTKQAKTLTSAQVRKALTIASTGRYAARDAVMILLSVAAGLRACEIAALRWSHLTTPDGDLADAIALPNIASKGKKGGRTIAIGPELSDALTVLKASIGADFDALAPVVRSQRGSFTAGAVQNWFRDLYRRAGLEGCSSHSGRRTFITQAARNIVAVGGSLKDVQDLAGHSSLGVTQRYIEGNSEARSLVVRRILSGK
jgi:integrase/recombinase XerD